MDDYKHVREHDALSKARREAVKFLPPMTRRQRSILQFPRNDREEEQANRMLEERKALLRQKAVELAGLKWEMSQ